MKTTATRETVEKAIAITNKAHKYKLELNRADQKGKWFNFTLKSKSGIPGSRFSYSGRKLPKASFHAHGYVMESIFEIEPKAVIISLGEKIYKGFKWNDRNVGSMMQPKYFSELSIE